MLKFYQSVESNVAVVGEHAGELALQRRVFINLKKANTKFCCHFTTEHKNTSYSCYSVPNLW